MKLLTSQKDTIYELIEAADLSPLQFEIKEVASRIDKSVIATELRFKNSEYYFSFDTAYTNPRNHYAFYCPGYNLHSDKSDTITWSAQCDSVEEWLEYLKREITSPNKWERLKIESENISLVFEDEESKFSYNEFIELKSKINLLKEGIPNIQLEPEQENAILNKLDHLITLAETMNKFDWKSQFVGTIISIVIQLGVSQDNAKSLWGLIKQVFNTYLLL